MLIEFRVENYRSIRDEQVLTMEAGRVGNEDDQRPRQVTGCDEKLLTVAVLYGANASGKTNAISALAFMRDAVINSHRVWAPTDGVPRDAFAWGPRHSEPSMFEVSVIINEIRYQYGFRATDKEFIEEWVYAWPNGKKQVWLERDCSKFKFGEGLKGENRLIEEVTRNNALFISAAVQHRHSQLDQIFLWFLTLRPINLPLSVRSPRGSLDWGTEYQLANLLDEYDPSKSDSQSSIFLDNFRSLLRSADIGIVDVKLARSEADDPHRRIRRPSFQLKHQTGTEDAWLPLNEESKGTQTLFRMGLPIIQAIKQGGVLLIDELESSLHPALAQNIVRQFNDPVSNPENAQIIFTTHDTNLLGTTMGEAALRRDQIWLTEKDTEGATVLYPLTDYMPRKAENIERGYLQGRYGAIPVLGNLLTDSE